MLRKPLLTLTFALLLAGAFCWGVAHLFALRYQLGDVYPPYSTLRTDPLGAKALNDALGELAGIEVRRNFKPLKLLQPGQPVTLVYAGVQKESWWTDRELQEFESLVLGGSRAVFTFHPADRTPVPAEEKREAVAEREKKSKRMDEQTEKGGGGRRKGKDDPKKIEEEEEEEERAKLGLISFDAVAKRFGFQFGYPAKDERLEERRRAVRVEDGGDLERELSWHSVLFFKDLSPEWRPLYLSDKQPVLVERSYGRGSIVLASDSFFLSNEALRQERHAALLARLFSGPPLVIFDEEHLGVTEQPGIAQLAVKYRLHGVIAGLMLIAALFVWKNAVRFIPAYAEQNREGEPVLGREASRGFDNMLHRAIKPADLLTACADEWRRASPHPGAAVARVEEVIAREQTLLPKQRNLITAYREIARALARR